MPSKFRYYIIDDYLNVTGTNSIEVAKAAFWSNATVVIDTHANVEFDENDDDSDEPALMDIPEHGTPSAEAP